VEAESGLMGGSQSQEFISISEYGEDVVVRCKGCEYTANTQVARSVPAIKNTNFLGGNIELVHTPNVKSLEEVANFLQVKPCQIIKTLIFNNENGEVFVFCIRGDYQLNQSKALAVTNSLSLMPASREVIERLTGAEVGYSGPIGITAKVFVDKMLVDDSFYISGANKTNYHIKNVNVKRDIPNFITADLSQSNEGDLCEKCGSELEFVKGIEVGHIFKLGTKYTKAFEFKIPTADGKLVDVIMGCYGIGVSRLMSAVLECNATEEAIFWPVEIAPFTAEIITLNMSDDKLREVSEQIYNELIERGIDVLWDNRDESAGVKFNDADLIGSPFLIVIGKSLKKDNKVEIKNRLENHSYLIVPEEVVSFLHTTLTKAKKAT
jgi:prolyl-tRNA synthetase